MTLSLVLFCIGISPLLVNGLLGRNLLTPFTILFSTQVTSLAVAYLKLHDSMTDFRPLTWVVLISSLAAFGIGSYLAIMSQRSLSGQSITSSILPGKIQWSAGSYNWNTHILLATMAFGIFAVGLLFEVKAIGTLILLSDKPAYYIGDGFPVHGIPSYFLGSSPLPTMLFMLASFKRLNANSKMRLFCKAMATASYFLGFLAMPTRTYMLIPIVFLALVFNMVVFRIRLKHVFIGLFVFLALFLFIGQQKQQIALEPNIDNFKLSMQLPYIYVANNWWNLDYALNPPSDLDRYQPMYGLNSISGFLRPMPILGRIYRDL